MRALTGTDRTFSRFSLGRPTVTETSWKLEVADRSSGTTVRGMNRSLLLLSLPVFSTGVPTAVMVPVDSTAPGRCRATLLPTTASCWSASLRLTSTTWAVEVAL